MKVLKPHSFLECCHADPSLLMLAKLWPSPPFSINTTLAVGVFNPPVISLELFAFWPAFGSNNLECRFLSIDVTLNEMAGLCRCLCSVLLVRQ